jgi:hypothetical protein
VLGADCGMRVAYAQEMHFAVSARDVIKMATKCNKRNCNIFFHSYVEGDNKIPSIMAVTVEYKPVSEKL